MSLNQVSLSSAWFCLYIWLCIYIWLCLYVWLWWGKMAIALVARHFISLQAVNMNILIQIYLQTNFHSTDFSADWRLPWNTNYIRLGFFYLVNNFVFGGSPGLVVMGGDTCSEGRWFESQLCILDGHFSHLLQNCNVCLKRWK